MKEVNEKQQITQVGDFISKAHADRLRANYSLEFPHIASSFIINKGLIFKILNLSPQVAGIRFMFGLTDKLNPNTVRILLVPCTSTAADDLASKPLISDFGYYDHQEQLHSLRETVTLIANFVESMMMKTTHWPYKKVTRGTFFGKNALLELSQNEQCQNIQFHFGFQDQIIKAVLEPLDNYQQPFADLYMDFAKPCPPFCPDDELNDDCLATMAVKLFANDTELNLYRNFRDHALLEMEGGNFYYELYYFISPLITASIKKHENREDLLKQLYFERIVPFKLLLFKNDFDSALQILKGTFNELIETYKVEMTEVEYL